MGKRKISYKVRTSSKIAKAKLAVVKRWEIQKSIPEVTLQEGQTAAGCSSNETFAELLEDDPVNLRTCYLQSNMIEIGHDEKIAPQYLFVDTSAYNKLVEKLLCPNCSTANLKVLVKAKSGFCSNLSVHCSNYDNNVTTTETSQNSEESASYDINRRVTKAFSTISKGYGDLEQFCVIMNMNVMRKSIFIDNTKVLHKASLANSYKYLEEARNCVRNHHKKINSVTEDDVINISVSYDGTWHKRGFTSNYGVGCVIDMDTGFIIDYCILSKFCRNCSMTKQQLGEDSAEYYFWNIGHKSDCEMNYEGSSPNMEVTAAETLWKRSLDYGFRYTTLVGDGDSKVFRHLKDLNVYGNNIGLEKEECINHVSKRLGTALKNLVKECKAKKVTLGGKSHGSLKDSTINKLTKYYHNAIASCMNKDENAMKQAVLATLHHCVSTDKEPKHTKCPLGDKSWCFYNRALACNETPGPHMTNVKTPISIEVLKYIAPIYKRLTDLDLLKRCVKGKTQNQNESLHSRIWKKCDKSRSVSKTLVETAVAEAVNEYNFGSAATLSTMKIASISPGVKSVILGRRRDTRRNVRISKSRCSKERRRKLRFENIKKEESKKASEGETYATGKF